MSKRFIIIATFLLGTVYTMQGQTISKNAIGLRIVLNDGTTAEVTYQRGLTDNNRLELDLGWGNFDNGNFIKLAGLYEWVFNLDKGFNWYVGPGGGVGIIDYDNDTIGNDNSDSFFFIAGVAGIEYNFDIPLLLSFDVRPEIGFGDFNDDLSFDIGIGVKYQF